MAEKSQDKNIQVEKLLIKLKEQIDQESKSIVDLDDEVNSSYFVHARLVKKFTRTYSDLCKANNCDDGTSKSKKIKLEDDIPMTPYPDINKAVENFLRKGRVPNCPDLLSIVTKVNEKKSLNISEDEKAQLAQDLLKYSVQVCRKLRLKEEEDLTVFQYFKSCPKKLPEEADPELSKIFESQNHLKKDESEIINKFLEMKEENEGDSDENSEESEGDPDENSEVNEEIDVNGLLPGHQIIDLVGDEEDSDYSEENVS